MEQTSAQTCVWRHDRTEYDKNANDDGNNDTGAQTIVIFIRITCASGRTHRLQALQREQTGNVTQMTKGERLNWQMP